MKKRGRNQLSKRAIARVLECIERHPDGLVMPEIQRLTGLSRSPVQRYVSELVQEKAIRRVRRERTSTHGCPFYVYLPGKSAAVQAARLELTAAAQQPRPQRNKSERIRLLPAESVDEWLSRGNEITRVPPPWDMPGRPVPAALPFQDFDSELKL